MQQRPHGNENNPTGQTEDDILWEGVMHTCHIFGEHEVTLNFFLFNIKSQVFFGKRKRQEIYIMRLEKYIL